MDIKRKIAMVVQEKWPRLSFNFADHDGAPDSSAHDEINGLLKEVAGRSPTPAEQMRFRRLIGDPMREFGDIWLEDYRCQLSLIDAARRGSDRAGVSVYEVVCHSWEGMLEFCLAARRYPKSRVGTSLHKV